VLFQDSDQLARIPRPDLVIRTVTAIETGPPKAFEFRVTDHPMAALASGANAKPQALELLGGFGAPKAAPLLPKQVNDVVNRTHRGDTTSGVTHGSI
jgi:hypothetical protein